MLAKTARREFSIDTRVRFGALDNAPHDVILDPETHNAYQTTYYRAFFNSVSEATDTDYAVETYTDQQATPGLRAEFLRTLERIEGIDEDGATFTAVCLDHGGYTAHVDPEDDQPYLDLATLYRNLVKERALCRDSSTLHVMLKGGDWTFGCQLVDGALGALDTPPAQMPSRVFTPQVLAPTGAKLSKSLLRGQARDDLPADVEPWMLDTTSWPDGIDNYVDALVWLVGELLTDPKHFFVHSQ